MKIYRYCLGPAILLQLITACVSPNQNVLTGNQRVDLIQLFSKAHITAAGATFESTNGSLQKILKEGWKLDSSGNCVALSSTDSFLEAPNSERMLYMISDFVSAMTGLLKS